MSMKENQSTLYQSIALLFEQPPWLALEQAREYQVHPSANKGHGQREKHYFPQCYPRFVSVERLDEYRGSYSTLCRLGASLTGADWSNSCPTLTKPWDAENQFLTQASKQHIMSATSGSFFFNG